MTLVRIDVDVRTGAARPLDISFCKVVMQSEKVLYIRKKVRTKEGIQDKLTTFNKGRLNVIMRPGQTGGVRRKYLLFDEDDRSVIRRSWGVAAAVHDMAEDIRAEMQRWAIRLQEIEGESE